MLKPETPNSTINTIPRELDSRVSDGIYVRLLWHPQDNRAAVSVLDTKTGDAFEIPVGPEQRALEIFHHPYAYADKTSASRPKAQRSMPTADLGTC